jgi:hypothetical protein
MQARAKQSLRSANALKGSHDVQHEWDEAIVIEVGQFTLGLRPDELVRIEFRRVTRKAVYFQPGMSLEKDLNVSTPMDFSRHPRAERAGRGDGGAAGGGT